MNFFPKSGPTLDTEKIFNFPLHLREWIKRYIEDSTEALHRDDELKHIIMWPSHPQKRRIYWNKYIDRRGQEKNLVGAMTI